MNKSRYGPEARKFENSFFMGKTKIDDDKFTGANAIGGAGASFLDASM